ncbi:MAG TPA: HEAT repeat domain-containing protein [Pyrinomonadaceae bacterium]|nr:HEAT repeat domain-containing protein [Pyrinomonadaceae bacterium]
MLHSNCFRPALLLVPAVLVIAFLPTPGASQGNSGRSLTPLQLEIEKQQNRLSSAEVEERRDALTHLGALHHPEASRAATAGLKDSSAIVRVSAASAVRSLAPEEAAAVLLPLLTDKDEFVRQETAYALGKTRSRSATAPLIELFGREKKDSARGAIIIALGEIGDEAAVVTLAQVLRPELAATNSKKRSKKNENLLVLRAAAHSLGQIGNRAAVPALVATLQDEQAESDVRREAAIALGLIGDTTALPALNGATNAEDPYLARAAFDASRRIVHQNTP